MVGLGSNHVLFEWFYCVTLDFKNCNRWPCGTKKLALNLSSVWVVLNIYKDFYVLLSILSTDGTGRQSDEETLTSNHEQNVS